MKEMQKRTMVKNPSRWLNKGPRSIQGSCGQQLLTLRGTKIVNENLNRGNTRKKRRSRFAGIKAKLYPRCIDPGNLPWGDRRGAAVYEQPQGLVLGWIRVVSLPAWTRWGIDGTYDGGKPSVFTKSIVDD